MQRIMLNNDIHSLSEFRSNASGFISQVHTTKRPLVITQTAARYHSNGRSLSLKRPLVITQNGKSAAVLLDVDEYEKLLEKIELMEDVKTAINEISSGKCIPHSRAREFG